MHVSTCLIYEKVQLSIRMDGRMVYLGLDCPSQDSYMNITLDREQIRLLADTLIESLLKADKGNLRELRRDILLERSAA